MEGTEFFSGLATTPGNLEILLYDWPQPMVRQWWQKMDSKQFRVYKLYKYFIRMLICYETVIMTLSVLITLCYIFILSPAIHWQWQIFTKFGGAGMHFFHILKISNYLSDSYGRYIETSISRSLIRLFSGRSEKVKSDFVYFFLELFLGVALGWGRSCVGIERPRCSAFVCVCDRPPSAQK